MTDHTLRFTPQSIDLPDGEFNKLNVSLAPLLGGFEGHTLEAQSKAALMDRVDTKYVFSMQALPTLLDSLTHEYSVLDMDGRRIFTYETTYLDTPCRHFYHAHHNGKLNRNKVRYRHYVDTNTAFLEVKLKNNKERTIKTRSAINLKQPDLQSAKAFIESSVPVPPSRLETALFVRYRRITLMNRYSQERLTLDLDLCFKSTSTDTVVQLSPIWLAELKRDNKLKQSSFSRYIKQHKVRPVSFSKYCIGSTLTDQGQLKNNRFKPTLRQIYGFIDKEYNNDLFIRH